jgi:hypothetical protein
MNTNDTTVVIQKCEVLLECMSLDFCPFTVLILIDNLLRKKIDCSTVYLFGSVVQFPTL